MQEKIVSKIKAVIGKVLRKFMRKLRLKGLTWIELLKIIAREVIFTVVTILVMTLVGTFV